MTRSKKISTTVGILYITGTVTGILSLVFTNSILNVPDYFSQISAHENKLILGAIFVFLMGLSLSLIPIVLFPVLKKINETLAVGYIVFRSALETVVYLFTIVSCLMLADLSHSFINATPQDFQGIFALGNSLIESRAINCISTTVFIMGAIMFYYFLYQSKLIPRWISAWGLIGAVPFLTAGFLIVFNVTKNVSTVDTLLRMPIAFQEMVLAVWLIVKDFNPVADPLNQLNK